jgi:alkanesulfonate monooxygenase SsuD/methylene tetrahydromethanopterin reductase-like flavin-dependent oxidoreductase (luciferase family)
VKVALMQEGQCPAGITQVERFAEMVDEAVLADEVGFDTYGAGEQHFGKYIATMASPETIHSFIAARTSHIRFRAMSTNLLPFNHPIRLAEQLSTLDILSGGRVELGAARSNNPWTLDGFGIPPDATREIRDEALDIILLAFTNDEFEYRGKIFNVPPRSLSPRPLQKPHLPVYLSATGTESHGYAARLGIGVMTGNTILGWEKAQSSIDTYKSAIGKTPPRSGHLLNRLAMFTTAACCKATKEEAKVHGGPVAFTWVETVMKIYRDLSSRSEDYAYLGQFEQIKEHQTDLDYLIDCSPYISMGTPDFFIERAHKLHAMGVDELIYRVDGMGHEENMATIAMLGKYVLPEVQAIGK